MAITAEREVARADMNDSYGVSLWQVEELVDYTTEDARKLAGELIAAADEADRVEAEDRKAAFGGHECRGLIIDSDGRVVL